jgi:hypothetical protein
LIESLLGFIYMAEQQSEFMSMSKNTVTAPNHSRKSYSVPELKVYGSLLTNTASGSRGNPEGGSGKPDKKA